MQIDRRARALFLALSGLLLLAPAAGAQVEKPGEARAPLPELGSLIDGSIRWLRAQQAEDGSYGEWVEGTALALQAFAGSPRRYARHDGPFVRGALEFLAAHQDPRTGLIHDPTSSAAAKRAQSERALAALWHFEDPASRAMRELLEKGLGTQASAPAVLAPEAAEELARSWLARRAQDGQFTGERGALLETAQAIVDLSRAFAVLKPKEAPAPAAKPLPPFSAADRAAAIAAMQRGALFLVATSQDGRFGPPGQPDAGMTAMAIGALQTLPEPRPEAVQRIVDGGLDWLVSLQDQNGAIHDGKLKNYNTSVAILALSRAGREEHRPVIERARAFLLALQSDEGEGYSEGDLYYGGIGYGSTERPDLSNLQLALEALAASGSQPGDEVFRKALKFLERTQNRSESNDTRIVVEGKVIVSGDDGGAAYAPGDSKAGFEERPDGTRVPRSYGSMTYALLKGLVFAGLPEDDPRMQAAWKWVREHYTLDVNPGFERSRDPAAPYQGLYYYFHSMARALELYGEELVVDAQGVAQPWRAQLCGRLVAMQRKDDGSWTNENSPRWWEGNPVLATSYALLTLGAALPAE